MIDTGLGISRDNQSLLFREFGKIDLGDKNVFNATGVGLGLLISHTIALELAPEGVGGLKVKSEEGKGSCFFFVIENRKTILDREENFESNCSNESESELPFKNINKVEQGTIRTLAELDGNPNNFGLFDLILIL